MEAVVLAGGLGTRLRQVVPDCPKPMAPVAGRPFLEILLRSLAQKGFDRVVMSLGFMSDTIVNHFGKEFVGMELGYDIEASPLGTGGAIRHAMSKCRQDHVFVFNGDTYLDLEVLDLEAQWQAQRKPIVVAREVEDTSRYGRLEIANGRLIKFAEKSVGGSGVINAGCYVFPIDLFTGWSSDGPFSIESDYLAKQVAVKEIGVFISQGQFIDIGIPSDYERAQTELAGL